MNCCSTGLWYDGYVLSVLKPPLKRVLRVLRRTFQGQYLRVNLLRSLVSYLVRAVYLGQGCLFHVLLARHPRVSPIDCFTASQKTGVCLSPGLYGFVALIHIGRSCYLCFSFYKTYLSGSNNFCSMRFYLQKFLLFILLYRDPPSTTQVDLSVDRKWGPLILCLSSQRRGGRGIVSGQVP